MINPFKKITFLLLTCLISVSALAQDKIAGAMKQLDSLATRRAQQLVYLQLSKGTYETGEDLWFKGYVMDARSYTPSSEDTTLYVELRHAGSRKLVQQQKVLIQGGFAAGHMVIRDTVAPGEYLLTAFTSGSFPGNDDEFKAFRKLSILERIGTGLGAQPPVGSTVPAAPQQNKLSIRFFPEGGHLVAGQRSCLAFKASKQDGNPVEIRGVLLEDGKPIDSVRTFYGGMGKLNFRPRTGKSYAVKISRSDSLFRIPEIQREGWVLRLLGNNSKVVNFLVTRSGKVHTPSLVISARSRGQTYGLYMAELKNDSLLFSLTKDKFPQGILEVTVYDSEMNPLVERLVYVNQEEKISISATLSKPANDRKDKVTLHLKATNEKGEPVIAHLGLSVYDALYKSHLDFLNIISYSQLYTQIRGEILNPDFYFDPNNKDREQALDLLLLTQGWRKYIWGSPELSAMPKVTQLVTDYISGKMSGRRELPKTLLALSPENSSFGSPVEVSGTGHFQISAAQMLIASQGYLYVKPIGNEQAVKNAKLVFWEPFTVIDSAFQDKKIVSPLMLRAEKIDTLKVLPNIPGLISLKEVVIKARGNGSGTNRDKYMAQLDSVTRFSGNFDFVGQCGWLNCGSCASGTRPVEGVPYTRFKDGRIPRHGSFNPNDIIKEPYRYSKYTDEELLKMYNMHRIQGYTDVRVFYSPDFQLQPQEKNIMDFRNTLYWNPSVITDAKGEASITFYTSDITGKFIGNIEGLDGTGRMGQAGFGFKVIEPKAVK